MLRLASYHQIIDLHLMVDELLVSPLLLRDRDVGQGGFKVQDLLHQRPRRLLGAAQENPELHQEVEVCRQILWAAGWGLVGETRCGNV